MRAERKRQEQREYKEVIAKQAVEKKEKEIKEHYKMSEEERARYEKGLERLQDSPLLM